MNERRILAGAFTGFSASVMGVAWCLSAGLGGVTGVCIALVASGAFGSAAHSAGGRAISAAFSPERHGLVLAIRHTAIPVGGALGGILIPVLGRAHGLASAMLVIALLGAAAAVGVFAALPGVRLSRPGDLGHASSGTASRSPLQDHRLWLLGLGCAGIAFVQLGVGSFLTLQLVDEGRFSISTAAAVYAVAQLLGAGSRIMLGVASDRLGRRAEVLRAVAMTTALLLVGALSAPSGGLDGILLVGAFVVATSWNGVAVATAVWMAPPGRTGATLGMQTTLNAAACAISPMALGSVLDHAGWRAFELVMLASLFASITCLTWLIRGGERDTLPACSGG